MEDLPPVASSLRDSVSQLPFATGVYLFRNSDGTVLYVGKALSLRDRVRSYFAKDIAETRNPGIERMVREAVEVTYELVPTELEALILEARLIRKYKPKYNIRLRDDKSFAVVQIDLSQEYPTVTVGREKDLEAALLVRKRVGDDLEYKKRVGGIEYYGPFTSSAVVKSVLNTLRSTWPFRDCSPSKYATYAKRGHGCMLASLHLCGAPCAGEISKEAYRKNIDQIRDFLKGDFKKVVREIEVQMAEASEHEWFEEAARLRNKLYNLQQFQELVSTFRDAKRVREGVVYDPECDIRIECYDISNNQGQYSVGSAVSAIVKGGKSSHLETKEEARRAFVFERSRYRKFKIRTVEGISDTDSLREVLDRRLKRAKGRNEQWSLPDIIVIDGGKGQLSAAKKSIEVAGLSESVHLASVAKGVTRKKVDQYGIDLATEYPNLSNDAWKLVEELLREEAHRFAITYYRLLHRKALFERR